MTSVPDRSSVGLATPSFGAVVTRLASAQKPGHGVPAYTRYVNRSIGRRLAALAYLAGMSPNGVTLLSGLVSLAAVPLLVLGPGGVPAAVAVTVLLLAGYALDSADGQLARLRGSGGPSGEWLDHVVDAARLPLIHAAVLVGLYRGGDLPPPFLLVPLGFLVVSAVRFFAMMLSEQLLASLGRAMGPGPEPATGRRSLWRSLALLPVDFGALALVFLLWGSAGWFAAAYGSLFAVNALWLALTLSRRYREISRLPVPS